MTTATSLKDRIRGAILGSACGDALGEPVEFMARSAILHRFGPAGIQHFAHRVGRISDDTQMSRAVVQGFDMCRPLLPSMFTELEPHAGLVASVSKFFVDWSLRPLGGHRAPGGACLSGCALMRVGHDPLTAGGVDAGGCGAIMRSAPYGLMLSSLYNPHAIDRDPDIFYAGAAAGRVAAAHAGMTHRHPALGVAPAAALAAAVAVGAQGGTLDDMVGAALGECVICDPTGKTLRMLQAVIDRTEHVGTVDQELLTTHPAWRGDHALCSAIHLLLLFPDDLVGAIRAAANIDGDSDSLAAIVGALVGVRTGAAQINNPDWIERLEFLPELEAVVATTIDINKELSGMEPSNAVPAAPTPRLA